MSSSAFVTKAIASIPQDIKTVVSNNDDTYLAGGCFVSILNDKPVNEYHIFTTTSKAFDIISQLKDLGFIPLSFCTRRPGHKTRGYVGNSMISPVRILFVKEGRLWIDLVICNVDPMDKIKNFNVSCCRVWYDGNTVSGEDLSFFVSHRALMYISYDVKSRKLKTEYNTWCSLQYYFSKGFDISTTMIPEDEPAQKMNKDEVETFQKSLTREFMVTFPEFTLRECDTSLTIIKTLLD